MQSFLTVAPEGPVLSAGQDDAVGGAETVEYTGQRQGDLPLTRAASTKPLVSRPAHQKKVGQGHYLLDLLPGHTYPFHEQGRTLQVEDHLDTQLLRLAGQVQPCLRDEEIRIEDVDPIQYVGRQLRSLQFRNGIPCVGENTMLPACGGENVGMERRAPLFVTMGLTSTPSSTSDRSRSLPAWSSPIFPACRTDRPNCTMATDALEALPPGTVRSDSMKPKSSGRGSSETDRTVSIAMTPKDSTLMSFIPFPPCFCSSQPYALLPWRISDTETATRTIKPIRSCW